MNRSAIYFTIASILLALPQTLAALVDLHRFSQNESDNLARLLGYVPTAAPYLLALLPLLWLYYLIKKDLLPNLVRPLIKPWLHAEPGEGRRDGPYYPSIVETLPRLLGLSAWSLAREAHIPWLVAWYLLRRPSEMLRPDLWSGLAKALLVRREQFKCRGSCGDSLARARLLWYHHHKIARGSTIKEIENATPATRRTMLRRIERQLCESLGIERVDI